MDHCGVCGGDDDSCRIIKGIYTRSHLNYGYNQITKIPQGACHINVTELGRSRNYLGMFAFRFPLFDLRDNFVHLHECSPFRVGIFIIFKKKTNMLTIHMCILLSKVLKHLYICYRKVYYYVNMETYNCP